MVGNTTPQVSPEEWISTTEACKITGICKGHFFVTSRKRNLTTKLINKPGAPLHRLFLRSEVEALAAERASKPRKNNLTRGRLVWMKYFGDVPNGMSVVQFDGNLHNVALTNLALVPGKKMLKEAYQKTQRMGVRRKKTKIKWTREIVARVKAEVDQKSNDQLAEEIGCSKSQVVRMLRKFKIRRSPEAVTARKTGGGQPIGTEVIHRYWNMVMVKVGPEEADEAGRQWRPKHHVWWERYNGRRKPKEMRVIFKDGDKRNFAADNLELTTRERVSSETFARYYSLPEEVQKVNSLNKQLQREVDKRVLGEKDKAPVETTRRGVKKTQRRWTAEMNEIVEKEYPTEPAEKVAAKLGVTVSVLRLRARRLGVRMLPSAIVENARLKAEEAVKKVLTEG